MTDTIYYFAYGMLTDPNAMDHNDFVGRGLLKDHSLEFKYFANVIKKSGEKVYGTVWQIDKYELDLLDQIEGYPFMYTRVKVNVLIEDGTAVTAEMYTMTEDTRRQIGDAAPKKEYMNKLISGYRHANIPMEQLRTALEKVQ